MSPAATPYKMSLEKSLAGPAGEHYVLAQLLLRGCLAALAPPRTPEADILVLSLDGVTVAATVQVKTRTRGGDKGWMMSAKHEQIERERLFYAFVDFEQRDAPPVYLIPSEVVAHFLRVSHATWLAVPEKNHKDNPIRRVVPAASFPIPDYAAGWMEQYRNAWEPLIGRAMT